eukprot:4709563-Prymnesium_polylepis.1
MLERVELRIVGFGRSVERDAGAAVAGGPTRLRCAPRTMPAGATRPAEGGEGGGEGRGDASTDGRVGPGDTGSTSASSRRMLMVL